MTPADLLAELERRNVKVSLAGDKLRLDAPAGALTPDLKEALRQHKPALVALLREQARTDAQAREASRLLRERGWVAIRSRVLNGETVVWWNGKVAVPARWQGAVAYTLAELRELVGKPPGPEELRQLHAAKKTFAGRIEGAPDG